MGADIFASIRRTARVRDHRHWLGNSLPMIKLLCLGGLDLTGKAAVLKGHRPVSVAVLCFPFLSVSTPLSPGRRLPVFRLCPPRNPQSHARLLTKVPAPQAGAGWRIVSRGAGRRGTPTGGRGCLTNALTATQHHADLTSDLSRKVNANGTT